MAKGKSKSNGVSAPVAPVTPITVPINQKPVLDFTEEVSQEEMNLRNSIETKTVTVAVPTPKKKLFKRVVTTTTTTEYFEADSDEEKTIEPKVETKVETKTEVKPETKVEPKAEVKPEVKPEPKVEVLEVKAQPRGWNVPNNVPTVITKKEVPKVESVPVKNKVVKNLYIVYTMLPVFGLINFLNNNLGPENFAFVKIIKKDYYPDNNDEKIRINTISKLVFISEKGIEILKKLGLYDNEDTELTEQKNMNVREFYIDQSKMVDQKSDEYHRNRIFVKAPHALKFYDDHAKMLEEHIEKILEKAVDFELINSKDYKVLPCGKNRSNTNINGIEIQLKSDVFINCVLIHLIKDTMVMDKGINEGEKIFIDAFWSKK